MLPPLHLARLAGPQSSVGTEAPTARTRRAVRLPRPLRIERRHNASLIDHLDELRSRIIASLIAIASACAIAWFVHGEVMALLAASIPDEVGSPVTYGVVEPLVTSLKVTGAIGLALAAPVVAWHAWAFAAPAVERRRSVAMLAMLSVLLFAAGVAFGLLVALPQSIAFLTGIDAGVYEVQLRASEFYSFAAAVLLSCGLVFQLPLVMLGLIRLGVLDAATLAAKRRTGYAVLAVIAVALPGVDPVLMMLELIPLVVLYEVTLVVAKVHERRRQAR